MYAAGHVLSSTLLAAAGSRRLNLPFVPLAGALIALNAVDFDHLIFFHLDNGTANSLSLHPLHIYGGAVMFLMLAAGLLSPRRIPAVFMLAAGLGLHLAADGLAHSVGYSIPVLLALDAAMLGLVWRILRPGAEGRFPSGTRLFFTLAAVICSGAQAFVQYALNLRPPESPAAYIVSPLLMLCTAGAYYLMFRRRAAWPA
jgi:hypothetical protein